MWKPFRIGYLGRSVGFELFGSIHKRALYPFYSSYPSYPSLVCVCVFMFACVCLCAPGVVCVCVCAWRGAVQRSTIAMRLLPSHGFHLAWVFFLFRPLEIHRAEAGGEKGGP